jgi:hypothetical protein
MRNRDRLQHIYVIHKDGEIGYIGKSYHPLRRIKEHFHLSAQHKYKPGHLEWLLDGDFSAIISWAMSNREAYRFERALIRRFKPLFNREYNWHN